MDNSRVNQTNKSFDCGLGKARVNLFNGRLLFTYPLCSIGMNNFQIKTSLIYNSHYKTSDFNGRKIGLGNGWKLDIEQHLFPYQTIYNIDGFASGDYVLIDSNWMVHRFVKYKTNNEYGDHYYDVSGSGLKLLVKKNENPKVYDDKNNIYCFDENGRMVSAISSVNTNVIKEIVYNSNNQIISIFDERKPSRRINFSYKGNLLTIVSTTKNEISFILDYDEEQKLQVIKKQNKTSAKNVMQFSYNSKNQLLYTINSVNFSALCYFYTKDTLPKVSRIDNGAVRKFFKTENKAPEVYVGEDVYFGEGSFVTTACEKIKEVYFQMPESYRKSQISFEYYNSYTTCMNEKGVSIQYSFNKKGSVISTLERKKRSIRYCTLSKQKGWLLSGAGTADISLNELPAYILSATNSKITYTVPTDLLEIFTQIFRCDTEKYSEHFTVSFWMKFYKNSQSNRLATLYYDFGEEETKSSQAILEDTLVDSWQYVSIPVDLGQNQSKLSNIRLVFEGVSSDTEIYLADMRIEKGNVQSIMIDEYQLDMSKSICYYSDGKETVEAISPDFYMTEDDILKTYQSLFYSRNAPELLESNQGYYDFVYCNGTKMKSVAYAGIKMKDGKLQNFEIDENNIPNYYFKSIDLIESGSWTSTEIQIRFYYDDTIGKYYYETKQSFGVLQGDPNKRLPDEEAFITYSWENQDGTFRASKSTSGVVTKNFYDEYGNTERVMVYNEKDQSEIIETIYEYSEKEASKREVVLSVKKDGIVTTYNNDSMYNMVNQVNQGNQLVIYKYDDYKEKIKHIEFVDRNKREIVNENDIVYSNEDTVKIMKSKDGVTYGFGHNIFSELEKIYRNKELILEKKITRSVIGDVEEQTIYQTKDTPIKMITTYDEYGKVKSSECEGNIVQFSYESSLESPSLNRVKEIKDSYMNTTYKMTYDDDSDITSVKMEDDQLELTTYSDNSMKYKIKTDDETITFKTTNENVLSSKVASTMYYKNEETEPVGYEDFSYTYTYDNLDRFSKKCSKETIFNKGKNKEAAIAVEQEIIYKEGTEVPVGIIYSVDSKIKNKTEDSASFSFVNGYDRYGNIISMLESGVRYETSPQTTATQNKVRMESRTNVYSYDSFNRLTKEENHYFGGIDYQYGNISGMIEKVIKTNGDQKTFSYEKGRLTNVKINDIMHLVGYDHYGNVTKTDKATITYNARNLMDSCSVQNTNVQYNYNYQGTRSRKQITQSGTTTYVNYYLDGNTTLGEDWTDSKGNITRKIRYFYDAQGICGLRYDGDNYTYIKDSIGNISKIMHNGKIIGEYIYDAWGNHEVVEISIENDKEKFVLYNNPFRYKEYYYDIETGLFYCDSRYYNPEWCCFLSPDNMDYLDSKNVIGLNLYCYCNNNPVMYADPSGHLPKWIKWLLKGPTIAIGYLVCILGHYSGIIGALSLSLALSTYITNFVTICYSYYVVKKYDDLDYSDIASDEDSSFGIETKLLTDDKTIMKYVNYLYTDSDIAKNWTKEQLYRELRYHKRGNQINSMLKNYNLDFFSEHFEYADVEKKQTAKSYILRFIGNVL